MLSPEALGVSSDEPGSNGKEQKNSASVAGDHMVFGNWKKARGENKEEIVR